MLTGTWIAHPIVQMESPLPSSRSPLAAPVRRMVWYGIVRTRWEDKRIARRRARLTNHSAYTRRPVSGVRCPVFGVRSGDEASRFEPLDWQKWSCSRAGAVARRRNETRQCSATLSQEERGTTPWRLARVARVARVARARSERGRFSGRRYRTQSYEYSNIGSTIVTRRPPPAAGAHFSCATRLVNTLSTLCALSWPWSLTHDAQRTAHDISEWRTQGVTTVTIMPRHVNLDAYRAYMGDARSDICINSRIKAWMNTERCRFYCNCNNT